MKSSMNVTYKRQTTFDKQINVFFFYIFISVSIRVA